MVTYNILKTSLERETFLDHAGVSSAVSLSVYPMTRSLQKDSENACLQYLRPWLWHTGCFFCGVTLTGLQNCWLSAAKVSKLLSDMH